MKFLYSLLLLAYSLTMITGCTGTSSGASEKAQAVPGKGLPGHYSSIQFSELEYTAPYPADYKVKLDSGAVAYMVRDTSLSLTKVKIFFTSDNLPLKPENVSSLSLYSSGLVSGGTKSLSPRQLEDSLEYNAAYLSASLGKETTNLSLNTLGKDIYTMMNLLKETVTSPGFDKDVLNLQKKKVIENIKHRFDKPWGVAGRAYEIVMYGNHPYNWLATEKEVEEVSQEKLLKMTGAGLSLDKLVISVSGDFKIKAMTDSLNRFIAAFSKSTTKKITRPFRGPDKPGIYLVDKDFEQATIQVGFPGLKRPHPDYYPLSVASYIFGAGGFTSRLVAKIRTEAGLAYRVRSFVESDYFKKGTVGFYLQTKAPSGGSAISLCFEEMDKMVKKGITREELDKAKNGLIQSLPAIFDTPAATADVFAQSEIWGRQPNHFIRYPEILNSLTVEQVNAAFKKYFNQDKARVLVVGPKTALIDSLAQVQKSLFKSPNIRELSLDSLQKRD